MRPDRRASFSQLTFGFGLVPNGRRAKHQKVNISQSMPCPDKGLRTSLDSCFALVGWTRRLVPVLIAFLASAAAAAVSPFAATQRAAWFNPVTVRLEGMAVPNGSETVAWFEWGTNSAYGQATATQALGNGAAVVRITQTLTGLSAQIPYWYRLVASNALGVVYGRPQLACVGKMVTGWGWSSYGETNIPPGLSNVVMLAAGSSLGMALRNDGTVAAWGVNYDQQTNVPPDLNDAAAISCGYRFSVALRRNGTLTAWGQGDSGQTNTPTRSDIVSVSAGANYGLALTASGTVVGWGLTFYGETNFPAGLTNVVEISAGSTHGLALRADGTVAAWGLNDYGQATVPAALSNVVSISAGSGFSAALKSDGTIQAWGIGASGQTSVPLGLTNVVALDCGGAHSVALKSDGTVAVWGHNYYGQTNLPPDLTNAVAVVGGDYFSLATTLNRGPFARSAAVNGLANQDLVIALPASDPDRDPLSYRITALPGSGVLYQWIGSGRGPAIVSPNALLTDPAGRVIYAPPTNAVGQGYAAFSYAASDSLLSSATATVTINLLVPRPHVMTHPAKWSGPGNPVLNGMAVPNGAPTVAWFEWGTNSAFGNVTAPVAIGNGTQVVPVTAPVAVLPQKAYWCRLVASNRWGISYGPSRLVCAARNAWTWTLAPYVEVPVAPGLSNLVAIASGGNHSLALRDNGAIVAWGDNYYGQTNVPAGSLTGVAGVAAGQQFSVALKNDGTVVAWGGTGIGETNVPTGLSNVTLVACGLYHTLALKRDGTVVAWGYDGYGYGLTNVPAGLSNVVGIAAGSWHSLALKADGTVVGWGSNFGEETNPPAGLPPAIEIAAGAGFSAALHAGGTITAWGDNSSYQTNVPPGLSNVFRLAAAYMHGFGLKNNLSLAAWGSQFSGPALVLPEYWTNVVEVAAGIYRDTVLTINRSPAAFDQHTSGPINLDLVVTLSGSDLDGDTLGYKITALPTRGTLYQYNAGARGPAIVAPGTALTDVAGRVIFAPTLDTYGDDYTTFGFRATDGELESPPAIVSIDITVPKPFVATQTAAWQSDSAALLRGAVMPNRLPTTAWFEWGLDRNLGTRVGETNLPATGQQFHLTAPLTGLSPQVAYWYRLVASNYWGVSYGAPVMFGAAKSFAWWGGYGTQTNGVDAVSNIVFAAAGDNQLLVVKRDGTLLAFGKHNAVDATPPAGLNNVVSAAGGAWHSLALSRDGKVTAWGYSNSGVLNVPADLSNVVAVAAGNFHDVALKQDGSVVGWGDYGGTVPVDLTNAVAVACGFGHSLALTCDGRAVAWGDNRAGQTNVPPGLDKVVAIAARGDHCVALRSNGTVVVWGRGDMGQTNVPTGLTNVLAIASGGYQCIALAETQKPVVWGWEYANQTNVLPAISNVIAVAGGPSIGVALALNRGPTALPGSGTVWANQDLALALTGTDPERDSLSFRVKSLPTAGTLYQFAAGVRGAPIVAPNTPVSDPAGRLIFAPDAETFGSNYASFTFAVNDGQYESAPALFNFAVLAAAPQAATLAPTWRYGTNALLRGMAAANGLMTTTWFEWGSNTIYGNSTPLTNAGVSPRVVYLTAPLDNLLPYHVYWSRLVVSNLLGVSYGQPQMFCAGKRLYAWGANGFGQLNVPFTDKVADLSAGYYHGLAVNGDGTAVGWGYNSSGQAAVPANVTNVVAVAGGNYHSLALQNNGVVRAWGNNGNGQTAVPADLTNAVAIAAGSYNSVALRDDGTALSWGSIALAPASNLVAIAAGYYHTFGLRCDGRVVPLWDGTGPLTPSNLTNVASIAAGDNHGLALKRDGVIVAWGDNSAGQTNVPSGLSNVVAISAGGNHSLALLGNGRVVGWGSNGFQESAPTSDLTNAVRIASGYQFNVAAVLNRPPTATGKTVSGFANQDLLITFNASDPDFDLLSYRITSLPGAGQLYQYRSGSRGDPITNVPTLLTNGASAIFAPGTNSFGMAYATFGFTASDGQFDSAEAQVRVDIVGQPSAAARRAEPVSPTAVKLNGSALVRGLPSTAWFDWGTNSTYGQSTPPVNLAGGTNLYQLTAGLSGLSKNVGYYFRLVVSNAAAVAYGGPQLFNTGSKVAVWGNYYGGSSTFVPTGLGYVTDTAAGSTHTVALRQDGTLAAWGYGSYDTGTPKTNVPPGLSNIVAVTAGAYHSAGLRRDGSVAAWGGGMYAFNGLTNLSATLTNIIAVSLGTSHLLALRTNGTVVALGPSGSTYTNVPLGLNNVVAVAAGDSHSLALKCDGSVVGWGTTPQATIPVWLSNVVAIAAGTSHSLALRADGTVAAWGANTYGNTNVPSTLSNVVAIAAGAYHSLALQANGTLIGWGNSSYGVTGNPMALSNILGIASGGTHNAVLVPNRAPSAVSPQVPLVIAANHQQTISLAGTDPDFDPLAASITALPAAGTLYQYVAGSRGAPIGSPGTPVADSANRVIFAPGTNEVGAPYAVFGFSMTDGDALSTPGSVAVNVSPLVVPTLTNFAYVSGAGFRLVFTGDANTVYCVWGSTDLVTWQYVGVAGQGTSGQFVYVDTSADGTARRFYRIGTGCP